MFNRRLVYYDLEAENSGWLFKSPLAGAGAYYVGSTTGRAACLTVFILTYQYIKLSVCMFVSE